MERLSFIQFVHQYERRRSSYSPWCFRPLFFPGTVIVLLFGCIHEPYFKFIGTVKRNKTYSYFGLKLSSELSSSITWVNIICHVMIPSTIELESNFCYFSFESKGAGWFRCWLSSSDTFLSQVFHKTMNWIFDLI